MIGRFFKIFLPVITVLSLFVFGALASRANAYDQERNLGSIRVCKIVVDANGNITDGGEFPGTKFEISGINPDPNSEADPVGTIGTSTFNTPLNLNSDLLYKDEENDAECITYDELKIGGYFYGVETITSPNSWADPKYNDQFTVAVMDLEDFFNYDGNLFDGNPLNDDARNKNADGHIVLNEDRPNRTLIVLNVAVGAPAVGGGQSLSAASTPSCPSDGPQKVDQIWFSDIKSGEVTVHWANKGDAQGYHIAYGPSADNMLWGVEVAGNLNTYTLKNLPGGDLFEKIVAKKSADCGGPTSEAFKVGGVGGGQVLGASTLAKTGVVENLMLFILGFGTLSLGLWQTQKALQAKSR